MKTLVFILSIVILVTGVFGELEVRAETKPRDSSSAKSDHEDPDGYYTCPMHPQVHEHKPGKCPICGMPLVKKTAKKPEVVSGPEIEVNQSQLNLVGIGKYKVTKKEMSFIVPVAGRMISSREVAFQVFESDLEIVKAGAEFVGSVSSSPTEQLKGQIRSIDNLVDPSSRTIRVMGVLYETPKRSVIEGSFDGEIHSLEKNQLAIPESAVLHTGKSSLVYIFSGEHKLKSLPVVLGKKTANEYQVLSGLNEGDVISTGPNFLLDSEAKIRGGGD